MLSPAQPERHTRSRSWLKIQFRCDDSTLSRFSHLIQASLVFRVPSSMINQTMSLLNVNDVRRILREALNVWSRGSQLSFQETYDEAADIQVLFAK